MFNYNNLLDLVNQKPFYPYEYIGDFEKFKEKFSGKEMLHNSLISRKIDDNE